MVAGAVGFSVSAGGTKIAYDERQQRARLVRHVRGRVFTQSDSKVRSALPIATAPPGRNEDAFT